MEQKMLKISYCIYEGKPHTLKYKEDVELEFAAKYCEHITQDYKELNVPSPALKPLPVIVAEIFKSRYFNDFIYPKLVEAPAQANIITTLNYLWALFIEQPLHEHLVTQMLTVAYQIASMKHAKK